jgi:PAS domain S-box-containing protein
LKKNNYSISEDQLNRLFPFYFSLNQDLIIESNGGTLQKIAPNIIGLLFSDAFTLQTPNIEKLSYNKIKNIANKLVVIECQNDEKTILKGQFEYLKDTGKVIFLGGPWFQSIDQIETSKLVPEDFAKHDSTVELLKVVKNNERESSEINKYIKIINKQKSDLEAANIQIKAIALFPLQNPDPLIRVDLEGNIILANPAAFSLKEYTFDGIKYDSSEFWKYAVLLFDPNKENYTFEVIVDGKIFSFKVFYLTNDKYYNIYGREVTSQKAIEKELSFLSVVASANIHGVAFFDENIEITWVNSSMEKLTGYSKNELVGNRPENLVLGKDSNLEKLNAIFTNIKNHQSFTEEYLLYKKDGSGFWARVQYNSLKNIANNINEFVIIEDITQQKTQIEEIKRLSLVASANENIVAFIAPDGRIAWVNSAIEKLTGYKAEEVVGDYPTKILVGPETDMEKYTKMIENGNNHINYSEELIHYRKDGSWFWANVQFTNIYDESGNLAYQFIIAQDITKKKEIEDEFERLSLVASANENGVMFTNEVGIIYWSNETMQKICGYCLDEIIGKNPIELLSGKLTDSNETQKMIDDFANKKSFKNETIQYKKDDSWYWGSTNFQTFQFNEGKTHYFAIIEDITLKKEKDEQLKILSSIAADNAHGVVIANEKGEIEWMNNSFERITGYTLVEMKGKKPGYILQGPNSDPATIDYLKTKIKSGEPFVSEIINYSKSGKQYWLRIQGQALKDRNNNILKYFAIHEDITQKKLIEQRLIDIESKFRIALEKIGDNIWEHNFITKNTFFTHKESIFTGKKMRDLKTNFYVWWKAVYKEDRSILLENYKKYKKREIEFHSIEYRMVDNSGVIHWVMDRGVIIERQIDGKPLRVIGTHTDITKIKETEKALRENEAEYKLLTANIPGILFKYAYYPDGTEGFIYFSSNTKEKIGLTEYELKNYTDYFPTELIEKERVISKNTFKNRKPHRFELKFNLPDRDPIWISVSSSFSYELENGTIVTSGILLNITKDKETERAVLIKEQKYRTILANMNLGLLELDQNQKITYANNSFTTMSGFAFEEVEGKMPQDLFMEETFKKLISSKNKLRKMGVSDAYEIKALNRNKESKWWLISAAPRIDDFGKITGTIAVLLDITKQKELEMQLKRSWEVAEESVKSKESFLANMSHEIRTPLNAIIGMINQLNNTPLTHKQNFMLETIQASADNLLVIINDILDLSKIEAGRLSLENMGFDLKNVIARSIQVLNHKAEEKGLLIASTIFDSKIEPILIGDPYRLNQILLNTIGNAIKFTEKGSVTISCSIISSKPKSQKIKISIVDTGIGMNKAFIEKLFEKFSQENDSVYSRFGGTGLGMSISKELVELMGGKIQVNSNKGIGTKVTIEIEFEIGTKADLPIKEITHTDSVIIKNKKILITDDNDLNRLVASMLMERYGAQTFDAENGREAIKILETKNIDLVLMDLQMPYMDGYEATKYIRETMKSTVPIIALTANAIKGESKKCIEAGMNDYISKPYKEAEFISIIADNLNKALLYNINNPQKIIYNEQLYDLKNLMEIGQKDEAFILKMLGIFADQTKKLVEEMALAYSEENLKKMGEIAHKLKPSLDTLNVTSLKSEIREIENYGLSLIKSDDLPHLLQKTQDVTNSIVEDIYSNYNVL